MSVTRPDGIAVQRLGLGGTTDTRPQWVDRAFRLGVDYFFFYSARFTGMVNGVSALCRRHRQKICVASGSEQRDAPTIRKALDDALGQLRTDFLDVFYLQYISPEDCWAEVEDALGELERWKAEGLVRFVGATAHDREIAKTLAEREEVDVLMHRYNMAHRKSEAEVLPAAQTTGIPVVAFTCTRWGSLLKGHQRWSGRVPAALDCYRFALAHPAVQVALTAPGSVEELEQNAAVLEMSDDVPESDLRAWRSYGDLVYGEGTDAFETRWP